MRRLLAAYLAAIICMSPGQSQTDPAWLSQQAFALFQGAPADQQRALDTLVDSGRTDAAPILILTLRFAPGEIEKRLLKGLERLTGAS